VTIYPPAVVPGFPPPVLPPPPIRPQSPIASFRVRSSYITLTVIADVVAVPADGVAVTVMVYAPTVVPGFVGPVGPLPPQLTPAATITTSRIASGTNFHLRCLGTLKRIRKQTRETAAPARGQLRPDGRLGGRYRAPSTAVVEQVIVTLPVSDPALNVIVLGAVKFWSGAPKLLQVGKSTAPDGAPLTVADRLTVPAKPFAPVTVIRHVPDPPGVEILIVAEVQPAVALTPGVPTLIKTP
jgi:hypothetical protein